MVLIVAIAAAGYWRAHRPPRPYKPDNSGLYVIHVDGKYGFMDRAGRTVITPQFDEAAEFSEGFARVKVGARFGFINTKGDVVIAPQFDGALRFSEGICCGADWDEVRIH